jgi:hypothetical protein
MSVLIHFVLGCPIVVFLLNKFFKRKGKRKPKKLLSNSIESEFLKKYFCGDF